MPARVVSMSDSPDEINLPHREMRRYVYVNDSERTPAIYCNNKISNTKYTLLNFLPKNLWEQFSRFMNKYFLLIACLQLWPLITPVNPASTWGPLIFIFSVSATKEAWDDYSRYILDKKANERSVWVLKTGVRTRIQAQHIQVGDILWLRDRDEVPCDIVLLGTSEPGGVCHVEVLRRSLQILHPPCPVDNDRLPSGSFRQKVLIKQIAVRGYCRETAAMDGESDLKARVASAPCIGLTSDLLHRIKGVIECPPPDKDVRRFDGNLRLFPPFTDNDFCSLTINNTLLQSCVLRNTEWACGVAVHTGNETKLGMSKGLPEPKLTAVDAMIDKLTGAIFVFQLVVVVILGVAGNIWRSSEAQKMGYVQYSKRAPWYEFVVIPLRFELLCSIMIPISIKVSLDLVKSVYSKFIDWDLQMYDSSTDTPAVATNGSQLGHGPALYNGSQASNVADDRSWAETVETAAVPERCVYCASIFIKIVGPSDCLLYFKRSDADKATKFGINTPKQLRFDVKLQLNLRYLVETCSTAISEDLGQIEYILTDKTGTLTDNAMILKTCFIKNMSYDVQTGDNLTDSLLNHAVLEKDPEVVKFLKVMAICNTVVPSKSPHEKVSYKSQSQDEEALVYAAACLHMSLMTRTGSLLEVNFLGDIIKFEILNILEFTSDRKKMSIIVRAMDTNDVMLLTKGADEAILPNSRHGQAVKQVSEAIERYSQMGLRTMCIAWKDLDEAEYALWSSKYKEASTCLTEREWKMAEVCELIERNSEILGATGIEDKLQDGVPETIQTLRKAGINFWMLTGDKVRTAIQIALSCNLVLPEPRGQLLHVEGRTRQEVSVSLERVLRTLRISGTEPKDIAFVIDGWALEIALTFNYEAFTELAMLSKTAICCRVTPSQKAQLVQLVKRCDYRTLAIGDGGNDVKMIQEAHVGVGISGREGLQAARASDFSLARFRFLKRLILVHGRYSYNRTAFLAQYSVYKSLLLSFVQILFSFVSGISGASLFNSFSLMAYNVLYTSVPVMTVVQDKDLSEETVLQHPEILCFCQAGRSINPSTFAGWFGRSLFHAIVVFLVTIHVYNNEKSQLEEVSMVAFSGCICLQAFVVALEMNSFSSIQTTAILGNLAAFYVVNLAVSTVKSGGMYTIMWRICKQPSYWFSILLIIIIGMGPILALKYFRFVYRPSAINVLQQLEHLQSSPRSDSSSLESPLGILRKEDIARLTNQKRAELGSVLEPLLHDSPSTSLKRASLSFAPDHSPSSPSRSSLSAYARSKNK